MGSEGQRLERDDARRTRLYRIGALGVTAALLVAVLVAVLHAGSTSQLAPGRTVPGQRQVLAQLAGIPQHGLALGGPRAPATLVEFADLQCPACAQFATEALPQIVRRYVRAGRLQLVLRPLHAIGPDSARAARIALALARQNRMWQFAELMYRNQGLENSGYVTETYLKALTAAIPGASLSRALSARSSNAVSRQLAEDRSLARAAGVHATPTFLLARRGENARRLSPSGLDFAAFEGALNAAVR